MNNINAILGNSESNPTPDISSNDDHSKSTQHPDNKWLTKIIGWKIAGTLSFKRRHLDIQNQSVKELFSKYNFHLNEEVDWKNVPVYWRWEYDKTERMHAHFVILGFTDQFNCLYGENSFDCLRELELWFKAHWAEHGGVHIEQYDNEGWLNYITKPNSIMNSCFSPPIHYLKRQILAGKPGCYFPWLPSVYNGNYVYPRRMGAIDFTDLQKEVEIAGFENVTGGQIHAR